MVIFVYREHYYRKAKRPQKKDGEDDAKYARLVEEWEDGLKEIEFKSECIVAKQRHGPTDTVILHFNGEYTTFGNWTDDEHLPYGG